MDSNKSNDILLAERAAYEAILKQVEDMGCDFKKSLFQDLAAPSIKPTPLKSLEMMEQEEQQKIDRYLDLFGMDFSAGFNLFLEKTQREERERIGNMIATCLFSFGAKLGAKPEKHLSKEDFSFLEEVAKRELIDEHFAEASCMFRLILQLNIVYSGAWVGWAISEQRQGHQEVVQNVFTMALALLPQDYYLILFASDFYQISGQKEMAKQLLEQAKRELIEARAQGTHSFKEIEQALQTL